MSLENLFAGASRAGKRLDYHQLNDGSDNEADIANRIETSIASNLSKSDTSVDQLIE